jgi:hypothetical protein
MAKSRERKMRDIIQVKCIKDEAERLLKTKISRTGGGSISTNSSDGLNRHSCVGFKNLRLKMH